MRTRTSDAEQSTAAHHGSHTDEPAPASSVAYFPTDPTGLPEATTPEVLELNDGAEVDLRLAPAAKQLGDTTVRMLAYNGSIPGPTLKVPQGSEVVVHVTNDSDLDTTVHWHGLRLENRYDGVPHDTQQPIPVGGSFTYRLQFPDPGLYWYHPHIREDYAQDMGLYGNILVTPTEADYWPPAHRDIVLTLDDVLIENGAIAPFSPAETTFAAMGRFGNVLLVGGEPDQALTARAGEVARLWLTNTANARVFSVRLAGARVKLVGGDSGRVEHEEFVTQVMIAPSERGVVDVLFDRPGQVTLEHQTPDRTYPLATFTVTDELAEPSLREEFDLLRHAPELAAERQHLGVWLAAPPDKVLAAVAEIDDPSGTQPEDPVTFACPMHPEVVSDEAGRCPKCGMKLLVAQPSAPGDHDAGQGHDMGHDHQTQHGLETGHDHDMTHGAGTAMEHHADHATSDDPGGGHGHAHGTVDGIEWEDDMLEVNRRTTPANTRWQLLDRTSGGNDIPEGWTFTAGDRIKIRLVNEMDSDHPMHHPFHLHGAGRFLVLARDDVAEGNLVWKDTVLLRTGQTVDILFEVTNPGVWMAHCHIPEHMHSGMMFNFTVLPGHKS